MPTIYRYLIIFLTFICAILACKESENENSQEFFSKKIRSENELNSVLEELKKDSSDIAKHSLVWSYFTDQAKYDTVIALTKPFFYRGLSRGNNELTLASGAYMAQAYLFKEEFDTLGHYLNIISQIDKKDNDAAVAILNNTFAIYYIKAELDYTKAAEAFKKVHSSAKNRNKIDIESVSLVNLSNVYYLRKDSTGIQYAKEAYRLGKLTNIPYLRIVSTLSLAKMEYCSDNYINALRYLDESHQLMRENNILGSQTEIYLTYGNVYNKLNHLEQAENYYNLAISDTDYSHPGAQSEAYLEYGVFLQENQQLSRSIDILKRGLDISLEYSNIEYRRDILLELSESYDLLGNKEEALNYYKLYHEHINSIFNFQKERSFNMLLLKDERIKHEKELQLKELQLEKNKKNNLLILISVGFVVSGLLVLWLFYRQKMLGYRKLVFQHQQYLNRKKTDVDVQIGKEQAMSAVEANSEPSSSSEMDKLVDEAQGKELSLFYAVEGLMKNEKWYLHNDISLEKLAEELATNRAYISKCINMHSGMNFYNYINMYRIEEATLRLSDNSSDVSLSVLSDSLGYNSISAFYRAFQKEIGCPPVKYREEVRRIKR